MRWQGRRESNNVEDRRGNASGGGGFRPPIRGKGGVAILIIVLVAGYYGVDLTPLLNGGDPLSQTQTPPRSPKAVSTQDDQYAKFTSVILADTEDTWKPIFQKMGRTYQDPKLVMYRGATQTGCGTGQSVMGPFYCPADSTIYIDLSFYEDMKNKLGAGGDFAQAYVIAHEVGHHVQHLMGIDAKVRQQQQGVSQAEGNRLSVKMELQADCFAGVWARRWKSNRCWKQGIYKKRSMRHRPLAMTGYNSKARAASCQIALLTEPLSNVIPGLNVVLTVVILIAVTRLLVTRFS